MTNSKLDVVLVVPGNLVQVYQNLASDHAIEPPVFALLIAAYLLSKGLSVTIIDQTAQRLSDRQVAERLTEMNPVLAILPVYGYQPSASTQNMPAAYAVARAIRECSPKTPIMMTGTHPAAMPKRTLTDGVIVRAGKTRRIVDYVCSGDGAVTAYQLVQAIRAGSSASDLNKVGSLWFVHEGDENAVVNTPPAPFMDGFEDLVMPWHLLPNMGNYRAHDWHTMYQPVENRSYYGSLITTLGCPFHCEFCCIQAPFRAGEQVLKMTANSYRYRKPKAVLADIAWLHGHGVSLIKVHDEMFFLNPKHVTEIASMVRDQYGDSINFWAYTRVDTTQPKLLDLMRGAGIRWLGVGIESANSRVRDGQDKSFSDEKIAAQVQAIHDADIEVGANYIFGLPEDTPQSMGQTLELAERLNTSFANFYCAMAYPGSKLHSVAMAENVPLPERPGGPGWIGYSQHAYECEPLGSKAVSPDNVLRFRDKAWKHYYSGQAFQQRILTRMGVGALATIRRNLGRPALSRRILGDPTPTAVKIS